MADVVCRLTILDGAGQIRELPLKDLKLAYRTSRFKEQDLRGEVILSTDFTLTSESANVLTERVARYNALRQATQPRRASAGSVFKNPPGLSAARLIERAGLKGKRIGNAQVSRKHANFIVNLGSATANDVLGLITLVGQEILHLFDVELELEIELVGEWEKAHV